MLDDLKKDRQAGIGAQEKLKLSLYVGMLIMLGLSIWMGSQCSSRLDTIEEEDPVAAEVPDDPIPQGPILDPVGLDTLVRAEKAEPDRWSEAGIEHLRSVQRRGSLGALVGRVSPKELAAASQPAGTEGALRGQLVEVVGRVTAVVREVYRPGTSPTDSERLWTVLLEGEDGTPVVAIKHSRASEVGEGPPLDRKPPQVKAERIEEDHWVLVRGVYLQDRVGTLGGTQLGDPAPVLFATQWRIVFPPDQRNPLISSLDDALWSEVGDRFMAESRNWEEDAVYETIQWARHEGYESIKAKLDSGELPWEVWSSKRFQAWRKEVVVDSDAARPLTDASRGKVFRLSGVVGEVLQFGWERIPRNPWGVDEFQILTMLADHYQTVSFRSFLPYPIETFEGVTGDRKEHLNVYGVFVKNLTYDTRHMHEDGSGRQRPITMPMFVVIHAEPYPEGAAAERIKETMVWVAAGMVLFGLLFYLVLIRGGQSQVKRMEEHRLALRRRARATGQGASAEGPTAEGPPPAAADEPSPTDG
ncbi:MAG: hypothetical protein P1V36_18310 [Planctomycetota bacterium]|nr:hypothetical protein [Planctomycetota bacterium]